MESGYTAKTEPTGFSDGLHVQYWRKIKITGDPGMTPNIDLSKQEEGSYHKKKKEKKEKKRKKERKKEHAFNPGILYFSEENENQESKEGPAKNLDTVIIPKGVSPQTCVLTCT